MEDYYAPLENPDAFDVNDILDLIDEINNGVLEQVVFDTSKKVGHWDRIKEYWGKLWS